jgi:hypothetical protein
MSEWWFKPSVVANGVLWLVGFAMEIGGWVSHTVAYALLAIALIWSVATIIYWRKKRKGMTYKGKEPTSNAFLNDHYANLAELANMFAFRLRFLVKGDLQGDIVGGLHPKSLRGLSPYDGKGGYEAPSINGISIGESIDPFRALSLLVHFNQLYPELTLDDWRGMNVKGDSMVIMGKLSILAQSKAFTPCLNCEVCQQILASHN